MQRTITVIARGTVVGLTILAGEVAYAIGRPLPSFEGNDPSGDFGDPKLPLLRMTALGDSTVTAPGLDHPHDSFVAQIAFELSDRYHVHLTSFAVGGAQSADVLRQQVPLAIESPSDLTLISVGSNDVLHATRIRAFERNLDAITAAMTTVSGAVVLMGVGDIGTVPRFPQPLDRIATLTGRIADRVHARVAARHGAGKADHWGWSAAAFRQPGMFAPDLFHPSAAGHRVWADTVMPEVERMLRLV
jgi:lysophospholipase L1-like esterase